MATNRGRKALIGGTEKRITMEGDNTMMKRILIASAIAVSLLSASGAQAHDDKVDGAYTIMQFEPVK